MTELNILLVWDCYQVSEDYKLGRNNSSAVTDEAVPLLTTWEAAAGGENWDTGGGGEESIQ